MPKGSFFIGPTKETECGLCKLYNTDSDLVVLGWRIAKEIIPK